MTIHMRDTASKRYLSRGWAWRYVLTVTLKLLTRAQIALDRAAGGSAAGLQRVRQAIVRLLIR